MSRLKGPPGPSGETWRGPVKLEGSARPWLCAVARVGDVSTPWLWWPITQQWSVVANDEEARVIFAAWGKAMERERDAWRELAQAEREYREDDGSFGPHTGRVTERLKKAKLAVREFLAETTTVGR